MTQITNQSKYDYLKNLTCLPISQKLDLSILENSTLGVSFLTHYYLYWMDSSMVAWEVHC